MVLERVRETIERHRMFESGERVLVAVSGGVDSVVLLHVLRALSDELGIALTVAHLDHGWRGEASAADARFVETLAEEWEIPVLCEQVDEHAVAAHGALGREGAARAVRRSFLAEASSSIDAARIALGHTADDRAETVLFNLVRGTGPAGAAGIDPVAGSIVRPLIDLTRADVEAYAREHSLTWREDATNDDVSFARNRIRHRVVPELSEINPRAIEAINRAADLSSDAAHAEGHLASLLWPDVAVCEEPGDVRLSRSALVDLPEPIRRTMLREAFRRARGNLVGIEYDHVEAVSDLLDGSGGHADAHLPGLFVRVDRKIVSLSTSPFPSSTGWECSIDTGRTVLPDRRLLLDVEILDRAACRIESGDRMAEVADADRVTFPLRLRNRRVGDRFTPLGMEHPIKLKDFLMNERVAFSDRDDVPLLCDRDRIIWVVGLRLSNDVRLTEETRRVLVMRAEAST